MKCLAYLLAGVNASDITKLKASGYYTVAVKLPLVSLTRRVMTDCHASGCTRAAQQALAQDSWLL